MKQICSKTILAALIFSFFPTPSADADWNKIAKFIVTSSTITALGFTCGWAQDLANDQQRLIKAAREYNAIQNPNPQAPGGPATPIERHPYSMNPDNRPGAHAAALGVEALILGALLGCFFATR